MESNNQNEIRPTPLQPEVEALKDTLPTQASPDDSGPPEESMLVNEEISTRKGSRLWLLWACLSVLLLALIATGSGFAGYNSAIHERTDYKSTLVAGDAQAQFDLALQDMASGNYERARQRLEYVIQLNPGFPNAGDQLARVLVELRITATPTLAPTPTDRHPRLPRPR
jgi:hypothetical protein